MPNVSEYHRDVVLVWEHSTQWKSEMNHSSDFWDALASHHSAIENNYLDLPSLRRIIHDIHQPVLVVGAGQGLIVEALQKKGLHAEGVDLSAEMIRYAQKRRGLTLVRADARAIPFRDGAYETIIYATGVVDFIADDAQIQMILNEARRIVTQSGRIFVAFYRISASMEDLLIRLGLLRNNVMAFKEVLGLYGMNLVQTIAWAAGKADAGYLHATGLLLRSWAFSTTKEKLTALSMQRIFRKVADADSLINAAPEGQPYRNEGEIRNLFTRLATPISKLEATASCYIVEI
jgi:SAM-dependent methyltransferase